MINYYAFFDNSLNLSNVPFTATDDRSAIRATRNMLLSATDDVLHKVILCTDLVHVGQFDEVKGVFLDNIGRRKVISLKDIPTPDGVPFDGGAKE